MMWRSFAVFGFASGLQVLETWPVAVDWFCICCSLVAFTLTVRAVVDDRFLFRADAEVVDVQSDR